MVVLDFRVSPDPGEDLGERGWKAGRGQGSYAIFKTTFAAAFAI